MTENLDITDLDVGVNITHPSRRHININIISPAGTNVELHNGPLAGPYDNIDATFNQSAATEGSTAAGDHDITAPLYDVQWNPGSGSLDTFNGEESAGTWTLSICDKRNSRTGTFNSAQLTFAGSPVLTTNVFKGTVFEDVNQNGENNSEQGVSGVTVTAYQPDGTVAGSDTTDANGKYQITGVFDGTTYRIEFTTLPADHTHSPDGPDSNGPVVFATST